MKKTKKSWNDFFPIQKTEFLKKNKRYIIISLIVILFLFVCFILGNKNTRINKLESTNEKLNSQLTVMKDKNNDLEQKNKKLDKTVKEYEDAFDSNNDIKKYVIEKIELLTEDYYNERIAKIKETVESLEKEVDDLNKEVEKNNKEIEKLEEGETLSYTFGSGFYQEGVDYEEGYYHIVALSGGGNVIDEYGLNEIMGPSNDGFYKKECDSSVSGELQVNGVTIKMTGKSETISEESQNKIDDLEETNDDLDYKIEKKYGDIESFESQQEELEKLRDQK